MPTTDIYNKEEPFTGIYSLTLNYTSRYIIPSSKILHVCSSFFIEFAYLSGIYHVEECWVGNNPGGQSWLFDGDQAQVKVNGQPSWDISQASVESDIISLTLKSGWDIVIAIYVTANNDFPIGSTPFLGYSAYSRAGNSSSETAPAGYGVMSKSGNQIIVEHIYDPSLFCLRGTVKEKGVAVIRTVHSYIRSTGLLYATTESLADGTFIVGAPDPYTEMYVLALDDDIGNYYNALIFDRVAGVAI